MEGWVVITSDRGLLQSFGGRVRTMWPILQLWTARTLKSRYRQSLLRSGWAVIQPAALLLTYGWVLTSVLDIGQEPLPYLSFAWAGLVPFTFVQQAVGQGVGSIQVAGSVISKVYFPREVLPLAEVGVASFDLFATVVILIVLSWVQIGPPTVHLVALGPVLLVLVLWASAAAVSAATITVFHRDLKHAMPLILRVAFIVTPIMYPIAALGPSARRWSLLNPLTMSVESVRDVTLRHRWPDWSLLAVHGVVGVAALVASVEFVRRVERHMTDRV